MFMYLSQNNFNLNKNKMEIGTTDSLVIVCVLSTTCHACDYVRDILEDIHDTFQDIKFAIVNIDKNNDLLEKFKSANISVTHTPTYLLFKLGFFDRILDIKILSKDSLKKSLNNELNFNRIIPKQDHLDKYLKLEEF